MIEERRSNLANEAEKARSNRMNEVISLGGLNETIRSNKTRENISWYDALERNRANLTNEDFRDRQMKNEEFKTGYNVLSDLASGFFDVMVPWFGN